MEARLFRLDIRLDVAFTVHDTLAINLEASLGLPSLHALPDLSSFLVVDPGSSFACLAPRGNRSTVRLCGTPGEVEVAVEGGDFICRNCGCSGSWHCIVVREMWPCPLRIRTSVQDFDRATRIIS